jgi:hypothetical protein
MQSMKTISLIVVFAILLGLAIGGSSANIRARHSEPAIGGAKVEVETDSFDFGEMDSSKDGSHDFKFTNKGTSPLLLTRGASTCRCTVGEIADATISPGESTNVKITWKSKHYAGPFKQSVTINTNDPNRREVILTITGQYTEEVHLESDELNFGQIVGDEPVTREARMFSRLTNLSQRILGHSFTDAELAKFFQVDIRPLTADEMKDNRGMTSGVDLKVTVKPGLPPGAFRQTILMQTNIAVTPELRVLLSGSMGKEVSIAGNGWDDELGVLRVGSVKVWTPVQRQLQLIARGANAKDIRYNVVHVEPDFLKVKLGDTELLEGGKIARTMLNLEIPARTAQANYMGDGRDKTAEIDIDTTSPDVHQLRIRVRFAVEDGK